jgi:hypothetical protein
MTFTYTYVAMKVSEATFKEIEAKLRAAGYEGQIHDDGATLDMHDIALVREPGLKHPVLDTSEDA